jgi:hypothetical protein
MHITKKLILRSCNEFVMEVDLCTVFSLLAIISWPVEFCMLCRIQREKIKASEKAWFDNVQLSMLTSALVLCKKILNDFHKANTLKGNKNICGGYVEIKHHGYILLKSSWVGLIIFILYWEELSLGKSKIRRIQGTKKNIPSDCMCYKIHFFMEYT